VNTREAEGAREPPGAQRPAGAQDTAPDRGSSLARLRALLLAEGGLMASLLSAAQPAAAEGPAQLAASGPRAKGLREEYELLVEAIYEGYLLHYDAPRVVQPPQADLGVLAGDRLYAIGLERLVKLGDVHAVAELADVITLTALAHGDGRRDLADAVWKAGARAVGWGSSPAHDQAKELARTGSPDALAALRGLFA
jgi:hypothetical protein